MASIAVRLLRSPLVGRCGATGGLMVVGSGSRARLLTLSRTFAEQAGGTGTATGAGAGTGAGGQKSGGGGGKLISAVIGALAGAGGFLLYQNWQQGNTDCGSGKYQKVYDDIAKILEEDPNYDYGSYGPVFIRLAWHASGTYDKASGTGGSAKGTMRHEPESKHAANAGLHVARNKLEKIKAKYPWISYGDLWTLAGVVAIQQMGGPIIPWRPGRVDGTAADCPPDGRLPDGANPTTQHPRDVFYRMGFNDQEITALIGAHTLGKCHSDRSGFEGPWTSSPTTFSNSFYTELLEKTWVEKKWSGPKQFQDKETGELMMLPADMAFVKDKEFKKWVETYAKDEAKFFADFAQAWKKLIELGVPFKEGTPELKFKVLSA